MQDGLRELVDTITRFQKRIPHLSSQVLLDPARDTDERAGMVLLVSAAIERFLRDIVRSYVSDLCRRKIPFDELPEEIRRHHFIGGAEYLRNAARQEKKDARGMIPVPYVRSHDVARRLASVVGTSYELVWEAFADAESNPGPKAITSIMKRLGVAEPWRKIEQHVPMNPYDPLPADGTLANRLNADLHELIQARNRCAHGAAHHAAPLYSELEQYLKSLHAIAAGMVAVLEAKQANLRS